MLTVLLASTIVDIGFFFVLVGLAAAIVMVARVGSFVRAHLPGMQLEIGQVNKAVNRVQPGEPTLIDQVRSICAKQNDMDAKLDAHVKDADSELLSIEKKLDDHISERTGQLTVITNRLDQLHEMIVDHLAPWDGKTDRRKESWEELDQRMLQDRSPSVDPASS